MDSGQRLFVAQWRHLADASGRNLYGCDRVVTDQLYDQHRRRRCYYRSMQWAEGGATLEADILTAHGYIVVTVHSGELAITTLRRSIPDLVVLDLELIGNIQGWDVLQELRTLSSVPVLITSSSATTARK